MGTHTVPRTNPMKGAARISPYRESIACIISGGFSGWGDSCLQSRDLQNAHELYSRITHREPRSLLRDMSLWSGGITHSWIIEVLLLRYHFISAASTPSTAKFIIHQAHEPGRKRLHCQIWPYGVFRQGRDGEPYTNIWNEIFVHRRSSRKLCEQLGSNDRDRVVYPMTILSNCGLFLKVMRSWGHVTTAPNARSRPVWSGTNISLILWSENQTPGCLLRSCTPFCTAE